MSNKRQYSRQVAHRWDTPGYEASATASTVVTNDWLVTDLIVGEIGINLADDRAWFRSNSGVVEFATIGTASSTTIWEDTGSEIQLESSFIGYPVIPSTDDTSDLGSATHRWKDLYLGSIVDALDHVTFSVATEEIFKYNTDGITLETEKNFLTSNGGGQLDLDSDGVPDVVKLSNDNSDDSDSYIKLESNLVTITSQDSVLINGTLQISDGIEYGAGVKHIKQELTITNWNMDTTATFALAHGLGINFINIREISVIIRNDGGTAIYDSSFPFTTTQNIIGVTSVDSTNINLSRRNATGFDATDFDGTGTRGWVTITLNT